MTADLTTAGAAAPRLLDADDATLRSWVAQAELPPLLAALAHVTGDLSLLEPALRPAPQLSASGAAPHGGLPPAAQERARALALDALRRFRDGGGAAVGTPDEGALTALMTYIAGDATERYLPLMAHELGVPVDVGAPGWTLHEVAPGRDFPVLVIGAGMSGLAAAHRLQQAGIPFVVVEKNADVGGTWLENTYPGCRLDTSNFAYSYSFAQKPDWSQQFSSQEAIHDYFSGVADTQDLRRRIRFETEVVSLAFDEEALEWEAVVRCGGEEERLRARAVVTAVGQLNRPKLPDIPGRERFAGRAWHSARWDHDVDLTGRRVAVVGTGASAYQIVPSIVDRVGSLAVFQRTPPWMIPTPTYHEDLPAGMRALLAELPTYGRWLRFYQFWISVEGRRPFVQVDAGWEHEVSVSGPNEELRRVLEDHLRAQFADRPDLLAKVLPRYPPGAKRMMRDNGVWAAALKRDHVTLETDGIAEIVPSGIVTRDGRLHEVDVIIYATGFHASDFLRPMRITGRGGADLHRRWDGDARAHLGIHVPGFPNLFMICGPNVNLVINGSIILFSEIAVHHTLECIRLLLASGHDALDCREDAFAASNERIDAANRQMAWGASSVSSWYKNARGRVSQVWPFPVVDYWEQVREPDPAHYELL